MLLHEGRKQTAGELCQQQRTCAQNFEEMIVPLGGKALWVTGVYRSTSELIASDSGREELYRRIKQRIADARWS